MNDIPSKRAFQAAHSADLEALAKKAGVVDHAQLVRFANIDQRIAEQGTVDITDLSDEDYLALFKA